LVNNAAGNLPVPASGLSPDGWHVAVGRQEMNAPD